MPKAQEAPEGCFLLRSGTPAETCVTNPSGTDLRSSIPLNAPGGSERRDSRGVGLRQALGAHEPSDPAMCCRTHSSVLEAERALWGTNTSSRGARVSSVPEAHELPGGEGVENSGFLVFSGIETYPRHWQLHGGRDRHIYRVGGSVEYVVWSLTSQLVFVYYAVLRFLGCFFFFA